MSRWLIVLAVAVACKATEKPGKASSTTTGTPGSVSTLATVDCQPMENPWTVECAVSLEVAGPVTLELSASGHPTRTFESTESVTEHTIHGWGLRNDTTYAWAVAGQTGEVTTGARPPLLDNLTVDVTGTLEGIDAVLQYVDCGMFVLIDGEGEVIGGLYTEVYDAFSDGMRWSQADRSVLALADATMSPGPSEYQELTIWGEELEHLEVGDFALDLTHDVDRWGGYTYLLGAEDRLEGFEVMDGTTSLGVWMIGDDFALNESHINGLTVSETGQVILSERTRSAVLAVDGDPSSPTFLQLLWHAAGEPGGGLPGYDYAPDSGVSWLRQHNASRHGDELWVFDNHSDLYNARAVRIAMDHQSGTLTELDSWATGEQCDNQGGALKVDGGALVTCANSGRVSAFRDGEDSPDWVLDASCGAVNRMKSTRAYPVWVE